MLVAYTLSMITPTLSRAARVLLGWNQDDLAEHSSVGINTIRMFEGSKSKPHKSTVRLLTETFEKAGIEFIEENGGGPGVRLRAKS